MIPSVVTSSVVTDAFHAVLPAAHAAQVREQCIGLSEVIEALNNGRYDLSIVLLDCCRSRASATLSSSIGSSGSLAAVAGKALTAKHGGVVFCAAQTGRKADDNFSSASVVEDDDQHGPFAAALLAHLLQPGVAIGPALVTVRDSVKTLTKGRQVRTSGRHAFFVFAVVTR